MQLIDKQLYHLVTNPLKKVRINNLFARFVVENKVTGKVYVDDPQHPSTFYVVHPYGMSLLFGDCHNKIFNHKFLQHSLNLDKNRDNYEWMQAFPHDWDAILSDLYENKVIASAENKETEQSGMIELNTRINFKFNKERYLKLRKGFVQNECEIVKTDRNIYLEMSGSVVPSKFWNSAEDFLSIGAGFSVYYQKKLATTAYSAFILDDKLEIGIETIDGFRGKGLAQMACSRLIDYCLEKNLEPVWACKLENTGSVKLAEKLGFEISCRIPYYRLCK